MRATLYGFTLLILTFLCTCGPAQNSQVVTAEGSREANLSGSQIVRPEKVTVMEGLRRPWSMTFLNEDEALLNEKDGDLLRVNLADQTQTTITGLPTDLADSLLIDSTSFPPIHAFPGAHGKHLKYNAGLFDLKLDPDFEANRWVYLSYAAQESETGYALRVVRGRLQDDALSDLETLLTVGPFTPVLFHFGGGLAFGPAGKLYVTAGERLLFDSEQPPETVAQNPTDGRGKIYRLNPDGSIPDDNPDFGPNAIPGLYAKGIRAAQGIVMHPETGELWFSEHGTNQGDELNLLEPGANYGWPLETTGKYRGGYEPPELNVETTRPKWYWLQTVAPTGLAWYFGDEFPGWRGDLLVPGLSRGSLWRIHIEGQTVKSLEELLVDDRSRTRKVVVSPEGKIYLLTDEENGKIIRVRNKVSSQKSIGHYLQGHFEAGELNGNVLVIQNDKTIYEASFGYADPQKQRLLTSDYRFGLGSIYKEFPAIAIMQLREQGKLTLDDRLSDHLPELPTWADRIRIKHLLRYTAGLPPVDWGSYFAEGKVVKSETLWQELLSLSELAFEPGTDYLYGNYPPFLLIALVEKLTSSSFHEYATENFFVPAGMTDITLATAFPYADNKLMAIPFNEQGEADDVQLADFHLLYCATTRDIAAWVRKLHTGKLLPHQALKLLAPTQDPTDSNQQSALGNYTIHQGKATRHMHHGSMGNYEGLFLHDPVEDLTIVLLTNQKHFNVHELAETIHAMLLDD